MTCKHVNSTFPGPKSGFYIMRMNQCEVSDKLCVAFILRAFEDTCGHDGFVSFWPVENIFSRKKSHHVSRPTIGYLWAKYKEF